MGRNARSGARARDFGERGRVKASGDSTEGGGLLSLVLVYVKENALLHVKRSTFFFQVFVFLKREREREFFEEIFFFLSQQFCSPFVGKRKRAVLKASERERESEKVCVFHL